MLLQDALDLIEFVSGPTDSEWGGLRNKMGRSKPWDLNYFAIGNEVSPASLLLHSCLSVTVYTNLDLTIYVVRNTDNLIDSRPHR